MIKVGFKYKAFEKIASNDKKMYSIMNYDSKNPTRKSYWTLFINNEVELYDKCMIIITEITGVNDSDYKGKIYNTIFCKVKLADDEVSVLKEVNLDAKFKEMAGNKISEIDNDSLPF